MTRLRILPLFVLVIAILLLAMGMMVVKQYEAKVAAPTPTVSQTQTSHAEPSVPRWIWIDPIGNKTEGDVFTITSTTNLSAGDKIHIEIYPAQYHHAMKNSPVQFSGCTDTVRVIPGQNGTNTISFTVHSSACTNLISMEYTITETDILDGTTGEARFNITPKTQPPLNQSSDPLWIRIDPISDKQVGDVFTITSTTNLSAGDEVLVEVMNFNWRHPLCGSHDTVNVITGVNGTNTISYTVNTSGYNPEKYVVYETRFGENAEIWTENETYFNITPRTTQPPSNQSSTPHLITIDPISDHYPGDVITITGTTTCNTGDIQIVIIDNNWHPCPKSSWCVVDKLDNCCEGVRIHGPILPGSNGNSTWSIEVNTSQHHFYPGTFLVEVIAPGCPMDEESYQEFYGYLNIRDKTAQPSAPRWWIRIDPISDRQVGDTFTITSTTNLSAGEEIIVYVNDAQGHTLQNFSGCTGGVTVKPGNNGTNTISFPVRPSVCQNLIPAEYSISEFDMFNRASAQASFNITPGKTS